MRLHTYMMDCEIRRVQEGVRSKDGKPYVLLKCEDMQGDPFEVTCNDTELIPSLYHFKKGDMVDLPVTIMATDKYQFVSLDNAPVLHEEE